MNKTPEHYRIKGLKQPSMEIIDCIVKHNTKDVTIASYLFMTLKYLFRFGKKDGRKIYTTDVLVNSITFVGSKNNNSNSQSNDTDEAFFPVDNDDIPF